MGMFSWIDWNELGPLLRTTARTLLLEGQIHQGAVVEAGGKAGRAEEVTLPYVRLRDYSGKVHFVPNGLISTVTNMCRGFAYALMDIGIAYRENVDAVLPLMREVAAAKNGTAAPTRILPMGATGQSDHG